MHTSTPRAPGLTAEREYKKKVSKKRVLWLYDFKVSELQTKEAEDLASDSFVKIFLGELENSE